MVRAYSPSQVILVAYKSIDDPGTGQIISIDLGSGTNLGHSFKELSTSFQIALIHGTGLDITHLMGLNEKTMAIHVYSLGKEIPVARFFGHDRPCSIDVSPDGRWCVGGNEKGTIYLWDFTTGELVLMDADAHYQRIGQVKFSMDGSHFVSSSGDGMVKLWSLSSWYSLIYSLFLTFLDSLVRTKVHGPVFTANIHSAAVTGIHLGFGVGKNFRILSGSLDKKCHVLLIPFLLISVGW